MKIAVIYWSGTGNTEKMAEYICSGIQQAGAEYEMMTVSEAEGHKLDEYDQVAFGCPAMGAEVLEETEFDPYFTGVEGELSGKKVALFGSYGWGDGEWMRSWQERVTECGAELFEEGLIACGEADESESVEFGKRFAS